MHVCVCVSCYLSSRVVVHLTPRVDDAEARYYLPSATRGERRYSSLGGRFCFLHTSGFDEDKVCKRKHRLQWHNLAASFLFLRDQLPSAIMKYFPFVFFLFQEVRRRRPGAAMANGASSAAGAGSGDGGGGGGGVATEVEDEEMKECGTADPAASADAGDAR